VLKYDYGSQKIKPIFNDQNYGVPFVYNLYLNELQKQVNDGFILYLDDDDVLSSPNSLLTMVNSINSEESFLIWRVQFPNRLVPSDVNFGKEPVVADIDTVGFLFHHKYKQTWEPYKRGDFRIAKKLYSTIRDKIYINKVLTKLQRNNDGGAGKQDDLNSKGSLKQQKSQIIEELILKKNNHQIKTTLEKTNKTIDYSKINQVFNNNTSSKIRTNNSPIPTKGSNTSAISKLFPQNKKRR
jgi:hypothetical protein